MVMLVPTTEPMRTFEIVHADRGEDAPYRQRATASLIQRALNFCRHHHVTVKSYVIENLDASVSLECYYHPFGMQPDLTGALGAQN